MVRKGRVTLLALRRGNVAILVYFMACLRLPPYADYMRLASIANSWSPSPYTHQDVDVLVGSGLRRQDWGKTMV